MNFLKNISLVVIFFALVVFGAFSLPDITQAAPDTKASQGRVSFKSGLSVTDTLKLASEKGLRVELLEGEFTVGSVSTYDFYPIKPGMDSKAIEADYKKSRLAYFQSISESQEKLPVDKRQVPSTQIAEMKAAVQKNDVGKITIKKVTFVGDENAIKSLSQNQNVEQATIVKEPKAPVTTPLENLQKTVAKKIFKDNTSKSIQSNGVTTMALTQTLPSIPNQGMLDTKTSSQYSGQREAINYMYWGNMNFGSTQAYEPEIFFENHDGQSFLNNGSTAYPGCFPVYEYATTNFPSSSRPYIDTRLYSDQSGTGCTSGELEFTIGAFQANQLQTNTTYWTYFRTTNGNASTDRMWLGGQVGHQSPSGAFCPSGYETWCIFGDNPGAGDLHADLVQAWKSGVPWQHYWVWDVRFCEHDRNGGFGQCYDLAPGTYDLTELPNFDNKITTVRIGGGLKWKVTLYENVTPATNFCYGNGVQLNNNGQRWEVNLYENGLNFNDKASCVVVELE
ncbi:MAG: hypothetical protein AAB553_00965 [Patescibacteria group bacterium]